MLCVPCLSLTPSALRLHKRGPGNLNELGLGEFVATTNEIHLVRGAEVAGLRPEDCLFCPQALCPLSACSGL